MKQALLSLFVALGSIYAQAQTVLLNVQHATCGNTTGSILASAFGGSAPYTFMWSPTPPAGQGTSFLPDLPPGEYMLTVTDALGNTASATGEVLLVPGLFPDIVPTSPAWSCAPGCNGYYNHYIPLSGANMPYTVVFDPPGPSGGGSPNGLYFTGMCPGEEYMVTVTDINGCTGTVGPIEVVGPMAPTIIDSTIVGSCPQGATGSMTLLFDQLDSILVSGPNGAMLNVPTSNPFTATNLAPGPYVIYAFNTSQGGNPPGTSGSSCNATITVVIPNSSDPCGLLVGVAFADLDDDCGQGAEDLGLPYRVLTVEPGGHHVLTNASGFFGTELFFDDYTLNAAINGYASNCIPLPAPFTLSASDPVAEWELAMAPSVGADVSSVVNAGVHVPGFAVMYNVSVINDSPYPFSDLTLDLYFDPALSFSYADGPSTLVGPGHVQWTIPALGGFSTITYPVALAVPPTASLLGTVVSATATVTPTSPDSDPANDSHSISRTIVGAYDPNDKLVQTSSRLSNSLYFLDQDAFVEYTIRFQNTGSAPAINVFLLDTIAPEFDLSSLQILAASHTFEASLLPGRVLRFDFPNIMLPDSTSDLLGSQGFASFRLRPVAGLVPGMVLHNAADIFFDFNEPIRTNDADLAVEFSVGIAANTALQVQLYPNPVSDVLQVVVPDGNWLLEVIAMDGRQVLAQRRSGALLALGAGSLAPGSYALRLTAADGTQSTVRFVKH